MNTPFFSRTLLLLALASSCCVAVAQTMEDLGSLPFETPVGLHDAGEMELMVSGTRDSSFNKVVNASPGWNFSATAIGNLVNVVTQGSNNTVVVNANQINKGSQQAIMATPLSSRSFTGNGATASSGVATNTGTTSYLDLR